MNVKGILLIIIVLAGVTGYFYKEKILLEIIEEPTSPAQEVGNSPISGSYSTGVINELPTSTQTV